MAGLTLLGTAVGWGVGNFDKITEIIFRQPRVQIVTDDPYVLRSGHFSLVSANEPHTLVVSDSIPREPRAFSVPAGAYRLSITSLDDTLFQRDITVARGEKRLVVVPPVSSNTIRVNVRNQSVRIGPGGPLEFQVEASGNGYVWVLQRDSSAFRLVYPIDCPIDCANAITATTGFHIPDAKGPRSSPDRVREAKACSSSSPRGPTSTTCAI